LPENLRFFLEVKEKPAPVAGARDNSQYFEWFLEKEAGCFKIKLVSVTFLSKLSQNPIHTQNTGTGRFHRLTQILKSFKAFDSKFCFFDLICEIGIICGASLCFQAFIKSFLLI